MQRVEDTGIVSRWLKEVIDRHVKESRRAEGFISNGAPDNSLVSRKTNTVILHTVLERTKKVEIHCDKK